MRKRSDFVDILATVEGQLGLSISGLTCFVSLSGFSFKAIPINKNLNLSSREVEISSKGLVRKIAREATFFSGMVLAF